MSTDTHPLVSPLAIAQIVARNITPLVGILFFDWSASNVLILYFIDTMLSMLVIFAGLAKSFSPSAADGIGVRIKTELTAVFVALFLTAFIAIPLGGPIGIVLAATDFSWRFAFFDQSLRLGILAQCIIALGSYVELYRALATHSPEQLQLKKRFGLVLMRWVTVMAVCYAGIGFMGEFGVLLLVAAYIGASIVAEIAPDRLLRGTPADDAVEARDANRLARTSKAEKQRR
jgi:hypothetical protein